MNKTSWIALVIEALIFILLLGSISKCKSDEIDLLSHNIDAYKSKAEQIELDNKDLLIAKESLLLNESQLREELDMSKAEIKDLKRKLGSSIAQISKLESQINIKDTVFMKSDTVYVDKNNNINKTFKWNDQYTSLSATVFGKSIEDSQLSIYDIFMNIPITFGITNDYKVFATSPNKNVKFTNVSSATVYGSTIAPKKKRFHHGLYLGFGLNYSLLARQWDFGPAFGYGFMYSF